MNKTYHLTVLAIFIALELVLMLTPLGYIPLGMIQITTMHIPVILAGLWLGKKDGAFIGLVFGITSVCVATFTPIPLSFLFTPFYSNGNFLSLVIALVPRVLLGYGSGLLMEIKMDEKYEMLKTTIIAVVMSLVHTILVLAMAYFFFGKPYSEVMGAQLGTVFAFVGATLMSNGILEAIAAGIIDTIGYKVVKKIGRK